MDVVKVDMQGVDVTEEDAGRLGGGSAVATLTGVI